MSDLEYIRVEKDGDIAIVTVDRQDKLNALNADVVREIGEAFDGIRDDDDVLGVILTGAGNKAFVAGADIAELATMGSVAGVTISREGQDVFRAIELFPKPVLAAVGGYALGGGCELALACHMRIASDKSRFGLPEVGLGIIPGYGGTIRLARLIGLGRAIELTLTGDMVDAERAHSIGLVSAVVPADDLLDEARKFLGRVTKNGPRVDLSRARYRDWRGARFRVLTVRSARLHGGHARGHGCLSREEKARLQGWLSGTAKAVLVRSSNR